MPKQSVLLIVLPLTLQCHAGSSSQQVRAIVDAAFPLLLTAIRSDHDKEAAAAAVSGCAALLKAGGIANCPPELWGNTGLMQAIGLVIPWP